MAKKRTFRDLPKLDNATPGFIMDQIGKYRDEEKEAKFWAKFYSDQLKVRFPDVTEVAGEVYAGNVIDVVQERFDTARFREEHPELVEDYLKVLEFQQVKVEKLPEKEEPKKD